MSYFPHDGVAGQDGPGAATLFLNDLWVAFLVLNDARYRALQRYLGVPREQANAVCFVAALMLVERAMAGTERVHQATPRPGLAETSVSLALASEVMFRLAGGTWVRDAEVAGTLVLIVIIGKRLHTSGRSTLEGARTRARDVRSALGVRYGAPRRS